MVYVAFLLMVYMVLHVVDQCSVIVFAIHKRHTQCQWNTFIMENGSSI